MTFLDPSRRPRPENTGPKQGNGRFVKGQSGNPKGKPKGARSLTTRLLNELAASAGEKIVKRLITRAAHNDAAAATILARIWPPPRSRAVTFKLPSIGTVEDAARAVAAILKAAAQGEMTPEEASTLVAVAERYGKLLEASNLEKRILALEQAAGHEIIEALRASLAPEPELAVE